MFFRKFAIPFLLIGFVSTALLSFAEETSKPARRDAEAMEILTRAVNAAGGLKAANGVRDLTASGEITFYWGDNVAGPVSIRSWGGDHFKMEADLPEGKRTWVMNKTNASTKVGNGDEIHLSSQNRIGLGNLIFPLGHLRAALVDSNTEISFIGVEQRDGRSVYKIHLRGGFECPNNGSVMKDFIIDALSFDILATEDSQLLEYKPGGKVTTSSRRELKFSDFRVVGGVRVPFSISTTLMGERTMKIQLSTVVLNRNMSDADFSLR